MTVAPLANALMLHAHTKHVCFCFWLDTCQELEDMCYDEHESKLHAELDAAEEPEANPAKRPRRDEGPSIEDTDTALLLSC